MTNTGTRAASRGWPLWIALLALLVLPVTYVTSDGTAWAEDDEPAEEATEDGEEAPEDGEEPAEEEAVELPWLMDVAEAKALAKKEGKDLFINFTGSDWCGWCKRLDAEVFHHAEFVDAATKDFVFLFLDFPRAEELKAAVVDEKLSNELKNAYGVSGFPTIIVADAEGRPYARTGYKPGGPEGYLAHLADLQKGGEAVKALLADETRKDVEALKAAFPVLAENNFLGYPDYEWTLEAAEKADPDGSLELKAFVDEEKSRRLAAAEEEALQALFPTEPGQEPDRKAIADFAVGSEHLRGPRFLNLCFGLAQYYLGEGDDIEVAKALIERAAKDPLTQTNEQGKQVLEQFRQRIADAENPPADEGDEGEPEDGDDEEDDDEMDGN